MHRKNFILGFLGGHLNTLITLIQGLLAIPYLLKEMNFVTYGAWISINEIIAFFSFLDFGVTTSTFNKISRSFVNKDNKSLYKYFWINFWVIIISFPILLILTFVVLNIYIKIFDIPIHDLSPFKLNVYFTVLSSYFLCLSYPCNAFLSGVQCIKLSSLFSILSTLFGFVTCGFLILNKKGLYCVGLANIMRSVLYLFGQYFCVYLYMKRDVMRNHSWHKHFYPKLSLIIESYKTSYASLLISISSNLLGRIDTIILPWFMSSQVIVFYNINKRVLEIIKIVGDSFINALAGPYVNKYYSLEKHYLHSMLEKIIISFCFIFYILISFYLILNKIFILLWVKDSSALLNYKIILLIAINVFFGALSLLLSRIIFYSEHQAKSARNIILEGGFKLILGVIGLVVYGIAGMLITFMIISGYIIIKNIRFIGQFIIDEINRDFFNKIIITNFIFFTSVLCMNSFLFYIFEKFVLYNSFLLFLQIGLVIWYHPHLNIKGIITNTHKNA